jgi:hypothetical protein
MSYAILDTLEVDSERLMVDEKYFRSIEAMLDPKAPRLPKAIENAMYPAVQKWNSNFDTFEKFPNKSKGKLTKFGLAKIFSFLSNLTSRR